MKVNFEDWYEDNIEWLREEDLVDVAHEVYLDYMDEDSILEELERRNS